MYTIGTSHPFRRGATAALVVLALVAAACGGSGGDASDDTVASSDVGSDDSTPGATEDAVVSTDTETTDTETTDTETTDTETTDTETTDTARTEADAAAAFPVTIEHAFGETTVDTEPVRVVSVGFAEHDGILALGVVPVAVRDWYGDQPFATWPWAQDELGDAEPEVLPSAELNFEQIAALDPDLILGISSGMSDADYETLSQIAPTIAQPGDYVTYGTPWQEQMTMTGLALGKSAEAHQVVDDTEAMFAAAREAHPEFDGATAAVAFTYDGLPGAYRSDDSRSQVLQDLGFVIPEDFDERSADSFYFTVSQEELAAIDSDVIVWLASSEAEYEGIRALTLRPTLTAYAEGREIVADPLLSGAFSHSSPLSLEFVIEELVPDLALAVDGDPATLVPSSTLLEDGGTTSAEMSDDEQAAADSWSLVFDSTIGFEEKADHLEDAEALRGTVESYTEAGSAMGGIALDPTRVTVEGSGDGATASITFDVYFGETAQYTALEGSATLVDGTWVVSRDEFCSFMASARNACPA